MPKSSEDIMTLYRTIGSAMWLDGLTDAEIARLDAEVISVFRKAMAARRTSRTANDSTDRLTKPDDQPLDI